MPGIQFEKVGKQFGQVEVLQDVNLSIKSSEFVSLVGPSGCGKTTLLRILAGLEHCTSGKVIVNDSSPVEYGQPLMLVEPS